MAFWAAVSWVRWAKVPLVLVKVPRWRRWSSARSLFQVWPVVVSATRMSSSASQQRVMWARIRSSSRWQTGARAQVDDLLHVAPAALDF